LLEGVLGKHPDIRDETPIKGERTFKEIFEIGVACNPATVAMRKLFPPPDDPLASLEASYRSRNFSVYALAAEIRSATLADMEFARNHLRQHIEKELAYCNTLPKSGQTRAVRGVIDFWSNLIVMFPRMMKVLSFELNRPDP
jgi:hypothetical protein